MRSLLRGSDLVVWYLNNSACRPLKGVELSTGSLRAGALQVPGPATRHGRRFPVEPGGSWMRSERGMERKRKPVRRMRSASLAEQSADPPAEVDALWAAPRGGTGGPPPAHFWLLFLRGKRNKASPGRGAGQAPQRTGHYFPHSSFPSSAGMTRFMASMATSIMESSGSKVVKFCIQRPGLAKKFVTGLSWPPT